MKNDGLINEPQAILLRLRQGRPIAVRLGPEWVVVAEILDRWRVDSDWWAPREQSRMYFSLLLADHRTVTVFRCLITQRWYRQRWFAPERAPDWPGRARLGRSAPPELVESGDERC